MAVQLKKNSIYITENQSERSVFKVKNSDNEFYIVYYFLYKHHSRETRRIWNNSNSAKSAEEVETSQQKIKCFDIILGEA